MAETQRFKGISDLCHHSIDIVFCLFQINDMHVYAGQVLDLMTLVLKMSLTTINDDTPESSACYPVSGLGYLASIAVYVL
ncbi:MAG: hypothetical protein DMG65_07175 [Candidatus Angelobacter sp. Gp1-AA117]|nr:MAG: hypothetical protein DMG65_07175 [Candidatus Angelobacter sp. Gp1-AA117]